MRTLILALVATAALSLAQTPAPSPSLKKEATCYELRTYVAAPGKMEDLHNRFRNHTMALFAKHGIQVNGKLTDKVESVMMGEVNYFTAK